MTRNKKSLVWPLVALAAVLVLFVGVAYSIGSSQRAAGEREQAAAAARKTQVPPQVKWTTSALSGAFKFDDVEKQSREYIGYYQSIKLTPEQEAIKAQVLKAMPAACCRDSSAYTCCCPCNLSKTLWGLSNYAIAKKGVNAAQLKEVVDAWMAATNQNGYSGDACYKGGCERAFHNNGCGGMEESNLSS